MPINHLIPSDADYVRWVFSSAQDAEDHPSCICLVVTAIALAIINIPLYVCQTLATSQWHHLDEAGKSLCFVIVTTAAIFASLYQDDVFAPPKASEEENEPQIEPPTKPALTSLASEKNEQPVEPPTELFVPPDSEPPPPQPLTEKASPSYLSIPMSKDEQVALTNLVTKLATEWVPNFFKIKENGETIKNLHPLRFIGFCMANLKCHFKVIRYGGDGKTKIDKQGAYWGNFFTSLSDSIKAQMAKQNLLPYIDDFAQTLGADPGKVRSYLNPLDCQGLVDYLLSL